MLRRLLVALLGLHLLLVLGGATALADARERSSSPGVTRLERQTQREHDEDERFERARASQPRRDRETGALPIAPSAPVEPSSLQPPADQASVGPDTPVPAGTQAPSSDPFFWYLARAAGLTAYLLLFLNVVFGLAVRGGSLDARLPRWRAFDLHQFTALLALALLGLHGGALMADRYVQFTLLDLLVPLVAPYRPLWTALGILAFYLMLVVLGSTYLRRFVGQRTWRMIHYLGFVTFFLALGHGVLAGSDTGEPWAEALYWSTGMTVLLLTLRRFLLQPSQPSTDPTGRRSPPDAKPAGRTTPGSAATA